MNESVDSGFIVPLIIWQALGKVHPYTRREKKKKEKKISV